jgi:S1-C subfamily serine protease
MTVHILFRKRTIGIAAALTLGASGLAYHEFGARTPASGPLPVAAAHAAPMPGLAAQPRLPDFADLAAQNGPAVVDVTVEQSAQNVALPQGTNPFAGTPFGEVFRFPPPPAAVPQRGLGSGFLLSGDGYLLTNAHGVGDAATVTVKLTDRREFEGKVIGRDRATEPESGARLGIVVADLSRREKKELGVDHGVLVRQVAPSIAARAGIQAGDVILQMNGKSVSSAAKLKAEVARLPDGKPVALLVKRGDNTVFLRSLLSDGRPAESPGNGNEESHRCGPFLRIHDDDKPDVMPR